MELHSLRVCSVSKPVNCEGNASYDLDAYHVNWSPAAAGGRCPSAGLHFVRPARFLPVQSVVPWLKQFAAPVCGLEML